MTGAFDSVLVANRGEIAVRVLRSARDLGYRTIAVFSEADAGAAYLALADEAVLIGPAPASESYLDAGRILDAARRSGAGAIHPGYGFLSENADFARACADAGIVFIGPSPQAIALMGNKAAAKRRLLAAGVPCVPGYSGADADDATLLDAARDIGFPLMVKAAAGGGGRGMRRVESAAALPAALEAARSEAAKAFGSGELILERALRRPRHVELQVFGDRHGNHIHLGERDCSVQRRHQKVIEEAPCPVMTPALRRTMGEAAVAAARSIDYVGAGTVEFLLDAEGGFYFLEMNTRLQVEHPVTECITGLDLVALQFHVARGGALPLGQDDVSLAGHAIEARLYAEDTAGGFLPASGVAAVWRPPSGAGLRVDHGLRSGQAVSPHYDPMIAKIIASGPDRETARRRLLRALRETVIFGLPTNRQFLIDLLEREAFAAGAATTAFIDEEFPRGQEPPPVSCQALCCAALLQFRRQHALSESTRAGGDGALAGFLSGRDIRARFAYRVGDALRELALLPRGGARFRARLEEEHELALLDDDGGVACIAVDGISYRVPYRHGSGGSIELQWRGADCTLHNELAPSAMQREDAGSGSVLAPMHGNLLRLRVAPGDTVRAGDEVAVMEAMKMEHRLSAGVDGVVAAVHAAAGQQLAAGALVLEIAAADGA